MLTTVTADVEIVTVFTCSLYGFNLFARWHQRLWFKRCGVWADRVGVQS